MDKSMIKGIVIGGVVVVAASAIGVGSYKTMSKPSYAEVIAVKDVTETVKTPREECQDVQVQQKAPVKDEHRIAGKLTGAVVGGALGSMVGSGRGKTVATVAGAVGGGYAGNKIQKNMQDKDVVTTTEQRCKTVYDTSERIVGYDVSYRLDGKQGLVRMDHKPGQQIPVRDGQLVLTSPVASK